MRSNTTSSTCLKHRFWLVFTYCKFLSEKIKQGKGWKTSLTKKIFNSFSEKAFEALNSATIWNDISNKRYHIIFALICKFLNYKVLKKRGKDLKTCLNQKFVIRCILWNMSVYKRKLWLVANFCMAELKIFFGKPYWKYSN